MSEEIMKAIVELIREGGSAAVWIVVFHYGTGLLKFCIGFGVLVYLLPRTLCSIGKGIKWLNEPISNSLKEQ